MAEDMITKAARATRSNQTTRTDFDEWWVGPPNGASIPFRDFVAATNTCDLLNLRAVLEAMREPSEAMVERGVYRACRDQIPAHVLAENWRAMIDAAIAEVYEELRK